MHIVICLSSGFFADDPELIKQQRAADPSLDHENPLEEVFSDQLACADMIVVSKSDMLDQTQLSDVMEIIKQGSRSSVEALPAINGQLDPKIILGMGSAAENDIDSRPSCHDDEDEHEHDDFDTFTLVLESQKELNSFILQVKDALKVSGVLRIKGFVKISGKPSRLTIQGVGERVDYYYDRSWTDDEIQNGQLVIIGLRDFNMKRVKQIFNID